MDKYANKATMMAGSGTFVNLLHPTVDMIRLEDILEGSRNIVRFNGQCNRLRGGRTINLAEHACRVYAIARWHLNVTDGRVLRACLLHDAHEVYTGDISSPMKQTMRMVAEGRPSDFDFAEELMAETVATKFDFTYPHPAVVKEADMLALAIEADITFGRGTAISWGLPTPIRGYRDGVSDSTFTSRLHDTYDTWASHNVPSVPAEASA